jgi:hypothetical protein
VLHRGYHLAHATLLIPSFSSIYTIFTTTQQGADLTLGLRCI